jgi:hypothetical protein
MRRVLRGVGWVCAGFLLAVGVIAACEYGPFTEAALALQLVFWGVVLMVGLSLTTPTEE